MMPEFNITDGDEVPEFCENKFCHRSLKGNGYSCYADEKDEDKVHFVCSQCALIMALKYEYPFNTGG